MDQVPIFSALSTSTRQLYLLLRCVAFSNRAEVYITPEGLRFTVEEAQTIQGSTLLDKDLFSSYSLKLPTDVVNIPAFQINIQALLETLQIFGLSEASASYRHQNGGLSSSYAAAFNTPALNLNGGTCRIAYAEIGAPLSITIDEGNVKTTCEINTYAIDSTYAEDREIPLDRNNLTIKIIMRSTWLSDAISELSNTNSDVLVINASSTSAPYFSLEGQGGPFGESQVDFHPDLNRASKHPMATEIFTVRAPTGTHGRVKQSYHFDLIKKAGRAMQLASKVSIRQDKHGVLSLQFMIEGLDSPSSGLGNNSSPTGKVSFIDFRFIALFDEDQGDDTTHGDQDRSDDAEDSSQSE